MTNISYFHRIDLDSDTAGEPIEIGAGPDFQAYVTSVTAELLATPRYKMYKFASLHSEVSSLIRGLTIDNWKERAQIIVERLHRIERDTREAVRHFTDLRKGAFVQTLTEADGLPILIFTKVDSFEYLDDSELKKRIGLPFNKKIQKYTLIYIDAEQNTLEVRSGDSNAKISAYWWKDFFELEEINSSESNTTRSFHVIEKILNSELKTKGFKSDFWELRNAVISYYRTTEHFAFDTLLEVIEGYQKNDPSVDMDMIVTKLKKEKEKSKFDGQFEISQKSITARIKSKIELVKNLELNITGEIANLGEVIQAETTTDGLKYIKIFSDKGYDEFKK